MEVNAERYILNFESSSKLSVSLGLSAWMPSTINTDRSPSFSGCSWVIRLPVMKS